MNRMNRRERRMAVATGVVVVLGGLYYLLDPSPQQAGADAKPQLTTLTTEVAAATATPPTAAGAIQSEPTALVPGGSQIEPSTPGTTSPTPAAHSEPMGEIRIREYGLARLQQVRQQTSRELQRDPFGNFRNSAAQSVQAPGLPPREELPQVTGVFRSGELGGALLDGKVCFVGDTIGEFRLMSVATSSVTVDYHGRELQLPYSPAAEPQHP